MLRVAVVGHSMEPTLRPGDWLLVDSVKGGEAPARGELVVVSDPRLPRRWLVKRVALVLPDQRLLLSGDHPSHRAESALLGPVPVEAVVGRPWLRYWPPNRFALLAGRRGG